MTHAFPKRLASDLLKTQGATAEALKSGLAGSARLQLRNGAIRGIDLNQTLSQVGNVLSTALEGNSPTLNTGFDLGRSEEHTSELQSLMRISYAVFSLNKKKST